LFNKSKTELIRYPASKTGSSYTIPNIVKSIGDSAFDVCSGLINITVPDSVVSIGDSAFNKTAWYDNQPDGVVYAGKVACGYKGDIRYDSNTVIILKPGTIGIADEAFQPENEANYSGLIGVSIPNSVTNIGDRAFYCCTDLNNVTIPKSVVNIGEQAFGYWSSLDYMDKISDLTFSCFANSAGQRYAAENGFAYDILPESADNTASTATNENAATTIDGSTRTTSASTTVNGSTSAESASTTVNGSTSTAAATMSSNGSTSIPATTTTNSSGTSNRFIVWSVILTMVAFLTIAATAVLIITKKKK